MYLKIMVDLKSKKVVFAEAGKDFVDFLIAIMRLPVATVTKVLLKNNKEMVGSLGALYKSIDSLKCDSFERARICYDVLKPSVPVVVNLLKIYEKPGEDPIYKCRDDNHNSISNLQETRCYCGNEMIKMPYTFSPSLGSAPGYVNGVFMVMDNLEIVPLSIALVKSKLKEFEELEETQVEVGLEEGLAILKSSMETDTVLTNVFFSKIIA